MFDQLKSLLRCNSNTDKRVQPKSSVDQEPKSAQKQPYPSYQGLERYTLIDKLGDGAFSNVYKALDLETQQTVAVKVIRKLELSQIQKANVLKEVQLMRNIQHPSIVKLYQFIETQEHYFLLLEYCDGGELFHKIVELTYFSEALSRHCICQVAEGIRYLHEEKGIVHRDIKPENLLFERIPFMERVSPLPPQQPLDGDEEKKDEGECVAGLGGGGIGRVKIADFGLSKVVWDQHTKTPCGTFGYTAPEIVKDEQYSLSVDMWALGCVLYTLLCGFPPFYDDNVQVLTEKVARGQYTFLSPWWDSISDEAKDLVSHLLCVDPAKRYTIQQFFDHPWIKSATDQNAFTTQDTPCRSQHTKEIGLEDDGEEIDTLASSTVTTTDTDDDTKADTVSMATSASSTAPFKPHDVMASYTGGSRRQHFTPDATSMKGMFDVTYAIQRVTEESSLMKGSTANARVLALNLNNVSDESDHKIIQDHLRREGATVANAQAVDALCLQMKHAALNEQTQHLEPNMQDPLMLKVKSRTSKPLFELSLDNATLIGRRRNTVTQIPCLKE